MSYHYDPAFPTSEIAFEDRGLSKREFFAAMALQGLAGNLDADSNADPKFVARDAVAYADAIIEELERTRGA